LREQKVKRDPRRTKGTEKREVMSGLWWIKPVHHAYWKKKRRKKGHQENEKTVNL